MDLESLQFPIPRLVTAATFQIRVQISMKYRQHIRAKVVRLWL